MLTREGQVRNGALYAGRLALSALLPLAVLPVFTRVLTSVDYGVLALVQVYAVFASALANVGLITAFDREFFEAGRGEDRLALLAAVVAFVGCMTGIVGVGTYCLRDVLAYRLVHSGEHGDLLFCAYCSAGVAAVNQYYLVYLRNSERAAAHLVFGICEALVGLGASLVLVVVFRVGVIGLVLGPLLGAGTILVLMTMFVFRGARMRPGSDRLRSCLRIGLPLTPRIFMGVLNNQFDKYMLGLLRTAGSVGFYSIGQMFGYAVFMLMTALQNVFSPQVYHRMFTMGDEGGREIGRYLTPFAYISVGAALLVVLFVEDAVTLLLPPSYHGSIEVAALLGCNYAILFFGKQPQIVFAGKTYLVPVLGIFSVALNVCLNVVFIARWGAVGAAAATLLAGLVSGAVSFAVSQRCYSIKWQYGRILAMYAVLFAAMLGLLLMRRASMPYAAKACLKIAALAMFAGVGMKCGVLRRRNVAMILDALLKKGEGRNATGSDG